MKKIIVKILLFLVIIELILRIAGWAYFSLRTFNWQRDENKKIQILCLGESTTFGIGANSGEDYPTQLGELLDKKYPDKFTVLNKGVPGITSSQILLNLTRTLINTKPDLVVLLCGANEFNRHLATLNTLIIMDSKHSVINNFFFRFAYYFQNLRLYKLLNLLTENVNRRIFVFHDSYVARDERYELLKPSRFRNKTSEELIKKQYMHNLALITKKVRGFGAEIIYSTHLMPVMDEERNTVAKRNQVMVVDLEEYFKKQGRPLASVVSDDGLHPNKIGYQMMAEGLLSTLEASKEKLSRIWEKQLD